MTADSYGLDHFLVASIAMQESAGNPKAIRIEPNLTWKFNVKKLATELGISEHTETVLQNSSFGLLQILGVCCREYAYTKPLTDLIYQDQGLALSFGCRKLAYQLHRYKNHIPDAVAAYNMGSVVKTKKEGTYQNQLYVSRVLRFYDDLKPVQVFNTVKP